MKRSVPYIFVLLLIGLLSFFYAIYQDSSTPVAGGNEEGRFGQAPGRSLPQQEGALKRARDVIDRSAGSLTRAELIDQWVLPYIGDAEAIEAAVAAEIAEEFEDFLQDFDLQHREEIQQELMAAYLDIRLVSSAMLQERLSENQIDSLQNPNYVLDAMSTVLSQSELNSLESELKSRARRKFDLANESTLEIASGDLSNENREVLLNTLFDETYQLTSPDGITPSAGLAAFSDLQIKAIENTRARLKLGMEDVQYQLVESFLDQRERAIATMGVVFDTARPAQ